jgi:hypothetical protein
MRGGFNKKPLQKEEVNELRTAHLSSSRNLLCRNWHLGITQVVEASQGRSLSLSG